MFISYDYLVRFKRLRKLQRGDKVAILSPSFAAPGKWPHVYELGLKQIRKLGLIPVEYPSTGKLGASVDERINDLVAAFSDSEIKGVVTTLGGDDQATYMKLLPRKPFALNPKPFFGFSDNTHFMSFLWLLGVPSYYGAALFTQFAHKEGPDKFTDRFINQALFRKGRVDLMSSSVYSDVDVDWSNPESLKQERCFEPNEGWFWDGDLIVEGITWGGCLESINAMLDSGNDMPTLDQFKDAVLLIETSEEVPSARKVASILRKLGRKKILGAAKGLLVGRPKAWNFSDPKGSSAKAAYRREQREHVLAEFRRYNPKAPVIQNLDFGHTHPQIPIPYGRKVRIDPAARTISIEF